VTTKTLPIVSTHTTSSITNQQAVEQIKLAVMAYQQLDSSSNTKNDTFVTPAPTFLVKKLVPPHGNSQSNASTTAKNSNNTSSSSDSHFYSTSSSSSPSSSSSNMSSSSLASVNNSNNLNTNTIGSNNSMFTSQPSSVIVNGLLSKSNLFFKFI
jgi:hypothetical protein